MLSTTYRDVGTPQPSTCQYSPTPVAVAASSQYHQGTPTPFLMFNVRGRGNFPRTQGTDSPRTQNPESKCKQRKPQPSEMKSKVKQTKCVSPIPTLGTSHPPNLPHRDTTPLGVHPRRDIHARQLLKQQLRRIRDVHLRNLRLVLARAALELVFLEAPAKKKSNRQ